MHHAINEHQLRLDVQRFFWSWGVIISRYMYACTWKARSDEMRKARSRKCRVVLHQSRSRISERGKSLRCWRASRLLSPLSCRLPYVCWAVNRLLYLWTRSPSSSILPVLDFQLPRDAMALGQANYFASRFACGRAVLIYYSLPANGKTASLRGSGRWCETVCLALWAARAKKVRKLCVNPHISIINPLHADIQSYRNT